jgi:TatD DNase family protein
VLEHIPLEKIVFETDSPYLAPVPHRGKRNESAYVEIIALKLADIKQTTLPEVARVTSENAMKLFNLQ